MTILRCTLLFIPFGRFVMYGIVLYVCRRSETLRRRWAWAERGKGVTWLGGKPDAAQPSNVINTLINQMPITISNSFPFKIFVLIQFISTVHTFDFHFVL